MLQKTLEISYVRIKNILYKTALYIIHYYAVQLFILILDSLNETLMIFHIKQYMKYHIIIGVNAMITVVMIIIFLGNNQILDDCMRYIADAGIISILLYNIL